MRISIGLLFLAALIFASCGDTTATTEEGVKLLDGPEYFGEKIEFDNTIGLNQLTGLLATSDSAKVTIEAEVESVCQAKGCWMNLVDNGDEESAVFVKFKDYGFFMPLDIAGQRVIAQGVAYKEVTSVDELRHYAEDGGASKEELEKITEPKEELKFMAHGVKLLDVKKEK